MFEGSLTMTRLVLLSGKHPITVYEVAVGAICCTGAAVGESGVGVIVLGEGVTSIVVMGDGVMSTGAGVASGTGDGVGSTGAVVGKGPGMPVLWKTLMAFWPPQAVVESPVQRESKFVPHPSLEVAPWNWDSVPQKHWCGGGGGGA